VRSARHGEGNRHVVGPYPVAGYPKRKRTAIPLHHRRLGARDPAEIESSNGIPLLPVKILLVLWAGDWLVSLAIYRRERP
jgi:hypothetical protein